MRPEEEKRHLCSSSLHGIQGAPMIVIHDGSAGCFRIQDELGKSLGSMDYAREGRQLTILRTRITASQPGAQLSQRLLDAMADYAREEGLKIEAKCPYAKYHFVQQPEKYKVVMANPRLFGV